MRCVKASYKIKLRGERTTTVYPQAVRCSTEISFLKVTGLEVERLAMVDYRLIDVSPGGGLGIIDAPA